MTIGIMQPYFLPYFGYFQLINSVDVYVNLDHVSFMKRSYMTRNEIKNQTKINVNVFSASQNKSCKEIMVNFENYYVSKFYKTIHQNYSKSKFYDEVKINVIDPCFIESEVSISDFNFKIIKNICEYLEINTKLIDTSLGLTENKKEKGIIDIVKHYNGTRYINAIGGQVLYDKENFLDEGIQLNFIQMGDVSFDNKYVSILDLLFNHSKEYLQKELNNYTLI